MNSPLNWDPVDNCRSTLGLTPFQHETKVLVRSLRWLEDGGGLSVRRVIYTHHQVSVVTMGT